MKCGGKSEQHERMMDLTVEIDGDIRTLEEALDKFTCTEILDGENKYTCIRLFLPFQLVFVVVTVCWIKFFLPPSLNSQKLHGSTNFHHSCFRCLDFLVWQFFCGDFLS